MAKCITKSVFMYSIIEQGSTLKITLQNLRSFCILFDTTQFDVLIYFVKCKLDILVMNESINIGYETKENTEHKMLQIL
jgi:hypothetical protein